MNDEGFVTLLRSIIREELRSALAEYLPQVMAAEGAAVMVSTAALCKDLQVSKQTLYNWLNKPKTKILIEANRQKVGSKVLYNIAGIRAIIKQHPALFGNGKGYGYTAVVRLTGEQKAKMRFGEIGLKIMLHGMVSTDDREWYEAQKKIREELAARHDFKDIDD